MAETRYLVDAGLSIDGETYPVASVKLTNVDNGIPTIQLDIVPEDQAADSATSKDRRKGTAELFLEKNDKLQQLKGRTDIKVEFCLHVTSAGELDAGKDPFSIVVNDWILVDAGIKSLSREGLATTTVVLQHPIYKYDRMPLGIKTVYNTGVNRELDKGSHLLQGLINGINRYIYMHDPVQHNITYKGTKTALALKEVDKQRAVVLTALMKDIDKVILMDKGNTATYPFAWKDSFNLYAKRLFSNPSIFASVTIYQAIKNGIVPMYMSMSGDFNDDPILVRQRNPWGEPMYTIPLDSVSQVALPPVNYPVEAVVLDGNQSYGASFKFKAGAAASAQQGLINRSSGALAGYFEWAGQLDGTVLHSRIPPWLSGYLRSTGGRPHKDRNQVEFNNQSAEGTNERSAYANKDTYDDALSRHAEDIFYDRFYRESRTSITTRCLLTNDTTPPVPGVVATVSNALRSGDSEAFMRMYITHVVHEFNVERGTAHTTVAGSHVTGPDGVTASNGKTIAKERVLKTYNQSEKE